MFKQEPDFFRTIGVIQNFTNEVPQATADHGDWGYDESTKTLTYLVSGKDARVTRNGNVEKRDIQLKVRTLHQSAKNTDASLLILAWPSYHAIDNRYG